MYLKGSTKQYRSSRWIACQEYAEIFEEIKVAKFSAVKADETRDVSK